jgi:ribokinase
MRSPLPARANRVVVVGSLNMDLVVRVPRLPAPGETVTGGDLLTAPGGKGANQATAAQRLGARVALIGRVGADDFGGRLLGGLSADGVDVSAVTRAEAPTGVALITVDAQGENAIALAPGANQTLSSAEVESAWVRLEAAQVCVAQLEVPLDAVATAFHLARSAGVATMLNVAPARALPDALLADTTVCVLNAGELAAVAGDGGVGADARERAGCLLARGVSAVVVTQGADETVAVTVDGGCVRVSPPRVVPVDTVGAGDAFVGCLAAFYSGPTVQALAEVLPWANAAGALATLSPGAQPALPTWAHLLNWTEAVVA